MLANDDTQQAAVHQLPKLDGYLFNRLSQMQPATPPDPLTILSKREEPIFTLKARPERPILFVTDTSGNVDALVHALAVRGWVRVENGVAVVTELGKQGELVLGGDLLDRDIQFASTASLIHWARLSGMKVTTICGNHELYAIAALMRPIPNELPDWALKEIHEIAADNATELIVQPRDLKKTVPQSMRTWIYSNGGTKTLEELAHEFVKRGLPHLPETPEETRQLDRIGNGLLYLGNGSDYFLLPDKRLQFLMAMRAAAQPDIREYFDGLVPLYRSGALLFLHAFVPYDHRSIAETEADARKSMAMEEGPWGLAFGFGYSTISREDVAQGKVQKQGYGVYPPGWELTMRRIPKQTENVDDRKQKFLDERIGESTRKLAEEGIEAVFHGHDMAKHFGLKRAGADPMVEDIKLVHCDTEGTKEYRGDHRGYVYVAPGGEVYCHAAET